MPICASANPLIAEVVERGVGVHEDPVVGEAFEQREDRREVGVVLHRAATGAVEERRREGVVSHVGEPRRDVADVRVHAERLLDHQHGTSRLTLRLGLEAGHRAVGGLEHEVVGLHVCFHRRSERRRGG